MSAVEKFQIQFPDECFDDETKYCGRCHKEHEGKLYEISHEYVCQDCFERYIEACEVYLGD